MEAPTHAIRTDLAATLDARRAPLDEARSDAVARQHARGRWTARERLAAFCDGGSLVEYGRLVRPKSKQLDGVADGLVMGHATVDGLPVCVLSYDYTVHAGTQSPRNHHKIDRMLDLAEQHQWPVVIWSEGGGARPHELNYDGVIETFVTLARLSGLVPTVSIVPGRAFAGHANIAGLVDVTIATRNACMGMAGPRLVEAATGESMTPEELGPMELHEKTGVIDLLVDDEEAAIRAARHYLSFFRGPTAAGTGPDVTKLRDVVPENPRRAYDVRDVIRHFADVESMLELRPRFAAAAVTALARIGGRPVGIVANQPMVLAGAIDAGAADKIARFISLCDAYDLPLVFLCDTPGFLVGHRVEQTGLVRHSVRTILALANATVPVLTVVLRKGYGLGYYAMGSDAFRPALLVAWPSAEFGGMGLEGAVDIMYGRELESTPDADRRVLRQAKIDELRAKNSCLAFARGFLVDDVVDPADTRDILSRTLAALPPPAHRTTKKHIVDAW